MEVNNAENQQDSLGRDLAATWHKKHGVYKTQKLRVCQPRIFANILRQQLYQYLCAHPCSSLSAVAERFKVSVPTVKYHVDKLTVNGYLSRSIVNKTSVVYPATMILPNTENLTALTVLNSSLHANIFKRIAERPGISRKELLAGFGLQEQRIDRGVSALRTAGLITTVKDGSLRRYYPSRLLLRLGDECAKRIPMFRKQFLQKLAEEGFAVKIERVSAASFTVWVSAGGRRYLLVINTTPFQTVFE